MDVAELNGLPAREGSAVRIKPISHRAGLFQDARGAKGQISAEIKSAAANQWHADEFEEVLIRADERERIARELHDSTSQLLVALELQLMRLKHSPELTRPDLFDDVMSELGTTIAELHEEVRGLTRPKENGPGLLIDDLISMAAEFSRRTDAAIVVSIDALPELPANVTAGLYRIAQEAVANAVRHGNARNITVTVRVRGGHITLRVADDGKGFSGPLETPRTGCGIANMKVRMDQLGGTLAIRNLRPGAMVEAKFGQSACLGMQ